MSHSLNIFKWFEYIFIWKGEFDLKTKQNKKKYSLPKLKVHHLGLVWGRYLHLMVSFQKEIEYRYSPNKDALLSLKNELKPQEHRNPSLSCTYVGCTLTWCAALGYDLHFIIPTWLQQTQQHRVCTCSLCQENSQLDRRHKFNKLLCECLEQMSS